jgi:hypothetical protein
MVFQSARPRDAPDRREQGAGVAWFPPGRVSPRFSPHFSPHSAPGRQSPFDASHASWRFARVDRFDDDRRGPLDLRQVRAASLRAQGQEARAGVDEG